MVIVSSLNITTRSSSANRKSERGGDRIADRLDYKQEDLTNKQLSFGLSLGSFGGGDGCAKAQAAVAYPNLNWLYIPS
jgi:hypothetical protein